MRPASPGPPGWPRDLPPPGSQDFEDRVVGWLLDRGPGELRTSGLRAYPVALAAYLERYAQACLDATRESYARARVELGPHLRPEELQAVHRALEVEGARLLQVQRELRLVAQALWADHA
ncbi:MAG: hypothetical protein KGP12_01115 [Actinomycetales bacterium]|nr:hypothetical protein [Actinomycetales bacterium]